ncbi:DUF2236 domain-containing protein [Haloechinothrix sp. YIM 98757]|uniref:DUF2236 domain-containing protein n=1 Tax=Haloechinothrix aidingensis TaxID=2752311 RepID=A0A837ZW91_9PSEU|nr:oxygenase MpaB family protein [Haloechinothrix aidingensis]MBA0124374.1 DUF2236 domain-containing protein [Haloechinothrix aidingensis]
MTHTSQARSTEMDDIIVGASLLAGTANVIMQLGRPGVGYGVVESTVESGQVFRHPVKRTRTTLTYLAVATLGTDTERAHYRRAVNGSHAAVRSGESSPVSYNAFDPELQLWVAACLYKGVEDTCAALLDEPDEDSKDEIYARAAALGTTLQVPAEMWPADRAAFAEYWQRGLEQVSIDDTVRDYLHDLVMLRFLPRAVRVPLAPFHRFVTTGFLPHHFREEMGLTWTPRQQRRFDRLMSVIATVVKRLPRPLRQFPYNLCLADLRRRIRTGRRLV